MDIQVVNNPSRGAKVVVSEKHIKTIPSKLTGTVNESTIKHLDTTSKRLSDKDKELLKGFDLFNKWKSKIAVKEKYLFELIKNAYPVEKFIVTTRQEYRYEVLLNTNIKVTIPFRLFNTLELKESQYHSNY